MKKIIAILCCMLCSHNTLRAQTLKEGAWAIKGGFTYQKKAYYELGIAKTSADPEGMVGKGSSHAFPTTLVHYDVAFSGEVHPSSRQLVLAPKLSTGLTLIFIGMRANVAAYTDFKQTDVRFTPEIGLTGLGMFNLLYGYNIPLGNPALENMVGRHRFSFSMNYFFFD